MKNRKDARLNDIFDYILIPDKVLSKEIDTLFVNMSYKDFMDGLILLKN